MKITIKATDEWIASEIILEKEDDETKEEFSKSVWHWICQRGWGMTTVFKNLLKADIEVSRPYIVFSLSDCEKVILTGSVFEEAQDDG